MSDEIINSMFALATCPVEGKRYIFNDPTEPKWERNDLSMTDILTLLEDQYQKKYIFDAVKQKLQDMGELYSKSYNAINSDIVESTKILICLHLLSESDQEILTEEDFFNFLPKYPVEDYKGNFISIAKRYHITISQLLKCIITKIDSGDLETILSWLNVFCGYKYSFVAPANPEEVMNLISIIETKINSLQTHNDERIKKIVSRARLTISLFRDEYLDPFEPGKPFS